MPWRHDARAGVNQLAAGRVLAQGVPGFFEPRMPPPYLRLGHGAARTSYYDTAPLRATLERLVDFDRINAARDALLRRRRQRPHRQLRLLRQCQPTASAPST